MKKWNHAVLKGLREKKDLNHTQLAAQVGVTADTIRNWENGTYEPRASQIIDLIRALDCDEEEFLERVANASA